MLCWPTALVHTNWCPRPLLHRSLHMLLLTVDRFETVIASTATRPCRSKFQKCILVLRWHEKWRRFVYKEAVILPAAVRAYYTESCDIMIYSLWWLEASIYMSTLYLISNMSWYYSIFGCTACVFSLIKLRSLLLGLFMWLILCAVLLYDGRPHVPVLLE